MNVPSIEQVQEAFADFKIFKRLGVGGEGVVFLVEPPDGGKHLALKILLEDGEDSVAQFEKEGRLLQGFDHSGIVRVYDYGEWNNFHYILMEYCEDGSLLQKIAEKDISDAAAVTVVARIGKGLYYAHKQGVLHRDVKPENVMMSIEGRPKIVDFGLAYCAGEDTSKLEAVGSEGYAAPEIWDHPERVSIQSDIYAMGALLYTVLTQKFPDAHNVNYNHLFHRDKAFIHFLMKAMAKDPSKRHASMADFVNDLLAIGENLGRAPQIW